MLSSSELNTMENMDINGIDSSALTDVRTVCIDTTLPQPERVEQYLDQIQNPYCFMSGETPVRVRFVGENPLSQSLVEYFSRLKQK